MVAKFLGLFLFIAVTVAQDCPDQVQCFADPCLNATCPRFLNAECRANFCGGSCTADFFRRNGRNITDRCPTNTCEDRDCRGERTCVEDTVLVPSRCLPEGPRCRQYLRTRCVLPPPPQFCSEIECFGDMVCVMRPSGPKCIVPRACRDLDCDAEDGLVCVEGDGETPPRCVPDPMMECSEIDILNCAERNQACVVQFPSGISQCVPATSCDQLPECQPGLQCLTLMLDSSTQVAACLPGSFESSCDDLECGEDQVCIFTSFPSRNTSAAACYPVESAMLPATCAFDQEEICAGLGDEVLCIDSRQNGRQAEVFCFHKNCANDSGCFPGQGCRPIPREIAQQLPIPTFSVCLPFMSSIEYSVEQGEGCPFREQACPLQDPNTEEDVTCEDIFSEGVLIGTVCNEVKEFPPVSCEGVSCEGGEECVVNRIGDFAVEAFCTLSSIVEQILQGAK